MSCCGRVCLFLSMVSPLHTRHMKHAGERNAQSDQCFLSLSGLSISSDSDHIGAHHCKTLGARSTALHRSSVSSRKQGAVDCLQDFLLEVKQRMAAVQNVAVPFSKRSCVLGKGPAPRLQLSIPATHNLLYILSLSGNVIELNIRGATVECRATQWRTLLGTPGFTCQWPPCPTRQHTPFHTSLKNT